MHNHVLRIPRGRGADRTGCYVSPREHITIYGPGRHTNYHQSMQDSPLPSPRLAIPPATDWRRYSIERWVSQEFSHQVDEGLAFFPGLLSAK